jgi:large repetitive protein
MNRLASLAAVALAAGPVVASAEVELAPYDAFISSKAQRPLKLDGLSKETAERVAKGRISSVERRLGVPTFFWPARDGKGLRELQLTAEQAARRYLFAYGELYRTTPGSLADARLYRLHDLGYGAIVAQFQKDALGVKVFNDEIKVVMNQQLELIAISGYLTPMRRVLGDFSLAQQTAIDLAYQQLRGQGLEGALSPLERDEAGFDRYQLGDELTPVRIRKVYYPLTTGLEPAFHLELELSDGGTGSDYWSFVFSARDGALLFRKNLTAKDFSYRVWADATGLKAPFDSPVGNDATPHPTGLNDMYNAPYVAPNLVTLNSGPISTNDPWLAANATTTDGNNVVAYADFNSPNGFTSGDLKATTTAPGVFDRTYDVMASPGSSADQRMAAVTQLFYNNNFFHDWFYDVGFDEASGNAQADNFGRGGIGGDALYAEAQDYSGTDNANMSTPSDGENPRMQMYVFTSGSGAQTIITGGATYSSGEADFGPQSFTLTGELVLVNDGDATNGTVTDGCQPTWSSPVAGKIAVIDRGACTFVDKVTNAQANGAIGALILNNTFGGPIPMPGTGPNITIPSLSMGRRDGSALKATMMAGTTTATLKRTATINRDGTIDNAIVAHEWGHYISNRLIGDGNGIANNQGYGMGEGWGDFHSMLLVVKPGDVAAATNTTWGGVYGLAAYTMYLSDRNAFYWGIRRYPYSTDLNKNPLTFKHIQDGVALPASIPVAFGQTGRSNSESHNTGEVWAVMLWECYAALLRDSGRLTFDQAQQRMKSYLVAGYKATPLTPTFVDARDAVLAAAAANDSTDFALFAAAFAKRGLGLNAIAPGKDAIDNRPVTEDFTTGNALQIVKVELNDAVAACDNDGHLDANESGTLTVTVKNVGVGLLSNITGTVRTTATGVTLANGGQLSFSPLAPFATATATVTVTAGPDVTPNAGAAFELELNEPTLASMAPVRLSTQFRLNYDAKPTGSINDDVEAPVSAWTFANNPNGATGSDFRRYEDSGTSHWFLGPDPDAPADTYLISPDLIVGSGPFSVTFQHRYQFEGDSQEWFDGGVIEISQDGRTWVDLGAKLSEPYVGMIGAQTTNPLRGRMVYSGQSPNYPSFNTVRIDLGTEYAGKTVKIRFRIGSDDALGLRGWEIDNLQFVGLTNRPFPTVVTDPNSCTNAAPTVQAPPARTVNELETVTLTAVASDPDNEPVSLIFTQVSGPVVTMVNDTTFTAPEVTSDTNLEFEVVATDGRATSSPVMQTVIVRDVNKGPVSTVSPAEQTVDEGAHVEAGVSAVDPEGRGVVGYRWVQVDGPTVTLTGATTQFVSFDAPRVSADTLVLLEAYATDGTTEGPAAQARVVVRNVSNEPIPTKVKPCGCSASDSTATMWLAALMGVMLMVARRRRG